MKETLVRANLHYSKKLKQACFDYIQCHIVQTLTDPGIMALETEDPELWGELRSHLDHKSNKRARKAYLAKHTYFRYIHSKF